MPPVKEVLGAYHHPSSKTIPQLMPVFTETPSDLHMQSSTWSAFSPQCGEIFVACMYTCMTHLYISPVYVGSISDIELGCECDFLSKLEDKPGVSIMADRGFMIQEMLVNLNIKLNCHLF